MISLTFTEQDLFNINEACGDLSLPEKIKRKLMCLRMHQQEVCHGVIPGKADPQLQLDFFEQELSPKLEEAGKGERKVFFVDAAHFVLGSFLGMIWCLKRIFIRSGSGRQRYNILGALDSHAERSSLFAQPRT